MKSSSDCYKKKPNFTKTQQSERINFGDSIFLQTQSHIRNIDPHPTLNQTSNFIRTQMEKKNKKNSINEHKELRLKKKRVNGGEEQTLSFFQNKELREELK